MGDPERRVGLVRIEREEQYFAVEDVLGRDMKSVFPNESRKMVLESDAAQAFLKSNKKFISETELADIKAATGGKGRVEDGSVAADKPLAEILRDQREAKEAKFQEGWKQMKIGKNRPLEDDELEFLDGVADAEAEQRKRVIAEERAELDAFHQALQAQEDAKAKARAAEEEARAATGGRYPAQAENAAKKPAGSRGASGKAAVKPRIKAIVRKASFSADQGEEDAVGAKRQKSDPQGGSGSEGSGGGLAGLLGDYGSDSDS